MLRGTPKPIPPAPPTVKRAIAVREAPRYHSITEGFTYGPTLPFLVPYSKEFAHLTDAKLFQLMKKSNASVYGYDKKGGCHANFKLSKLIDTHLDPKKKLGVSIVDSPVALTRLPREFTQHHRKSRVDRSLSTIALGQTPVLTDSGSYTYLHFDPVQFGGGWMYIAEGKKIWNFLDPRWIPEIYDRKEDKPSDINPKSFLEWVSAQPRRVKLFQEAPLLTTVAEAGSFTYFPPGWLHQVWTPMRATGIGGYLRPNGTLSYANSVKRELASHDISAEW